jgi:hypothetical protein
MAPRQIPDFVSVLDVNAVFESLNECVGHRNQGFFGNSLVGCYDNAVNVPMF